jgi:hypothetical protein
MLALWEWILQPAHLAGIVGALLAGAAGTKALADANRRRQVALAISHGVAIARDIAQETPGKDAWDLITSALVAADKWMVENHWRPLSEKEAEAARPKVLANLPSGHRGGFPLQRGRG